MQVINGVAEIAQNYDTILLDQFGVIHNGVRAYPRALRAISRLHASGVKIIILSNSSRRSHHALGKLVKMGVDPASIHTIITSGELAHRHVRDNLPQFETLRVLHFNWNSSRGSISLKDHGLHSVASPSSSNQYQLPDSSDVDLILAHGTDGVTLPDGTVHSVPFEVLRELCLNIARERPHVPFICANPDIVTVDGPNLRVMPGTLAAAFEEAGGLDVRRLGKPSAAAYDYAKQTGGSKYLAIGDSMGHDILGGVLAGIDSLYVAGGIDAESFRIDPESGFCDERPEWTWDQGVLNQIAAREAPSLGTRRPTYVVPFFRWD